MSFWKSQYHIARKEHVCEYCNKKILVGEKYSRESGMYEGEFNDYCLCDRCRNIISYVKSESGDYELGTLFDDLNNSDFFACPVCHSIGPHEYSFPDNKMSIDIECDMCNHKFTVNLSEESILAHFKGGK
jgi:DNA-directed RNA polymerase subunit RPC12/RpoP